MAEGKENAMAAADRHFISVYKDKYPGQLSPWRKTGMISFRFMIFVPPIGFTSEPPIDLSRRSLPHEADEGMWIAHCYTDDGFQGASGVTEDLEKT